MTIYASEGPYIRETAFEGQVYELFANSESEQRSSLRQALEGFADMPAIQLIIDSLDPGFDIEGIQLITDVPNAIRPRSTFRSDIFPLEGNSNHRQIEIRLNTRTIEILIFEGDFGPDGQEGIAFGNREKSLYTYTNTTTSMTISPDLSGDLDIVLSSGTSTLSFVVFKEGGLQLLKYQAALNSRETRLDLTSVSHRFPDLANLIRNGGRFDLRQSMAEIIHRALSYLPESQSMITGDLTSIQLTEASAEP